MLICDFDNNDCRGYKIRYVVFVTILRYKADL